MVDITSINKSILERKKQLHIELDHILDQLKELGVLKVILFGSLNKDDIDLFSDIDLFIIMPNSKLTKEWINFLYTNVERNIASDLVVYNQKDFNDMLPRSTFLEQIIEKGKILYEKT
ncbi:MAG: nucleotidyltransferase domain-containing protein [Candidatus Lokiarchaeota archaeon]